MSGAQVRDAMRRLGSSSEECARLIAALSCLKSATESGRRLFPDASMMKWTASVLLGVLYWRCLFLWGRWWAQGGQKFLAIRTHKERQRLSPDRRSARKPGNSTPTPQPFTARPSLIHSLHPVDPQRDFPSSSLRLGVGGTHTWGTSVVCALRRPSNRSLPDAFSSASRTHLYPARNPTIEAASPTKAPLHPAASVAQSAAAAPQHNPDAQQKPRIAAGQAHRRPARQQVGVPKPASERIFIWIL